MYKFEKRVMKWWDSTKHTIQSTILCIKYPFIYPVNAWTGRHYNNYDIVEYLKKIKNKKIWYRIVKFFYDKVFPIFHCIPSFTMYDLMPKGWKNAFGEQYLKDFKAVLKKTGTLRYWKIYDIKEKYGTLRTASNFYNEEVYKVVLKYENLSMQYCIECGKPATVVSDGWICPYCDNCYSRFYGSHVSNTIVKNGEWVARKELKK